jgi:hypothetical protein
VPARDPQSGTAFRLITSQIRVQVLQASSGFPTALCQDSCGTLHTVGGPWMAQIDDMLSPKYTHGQVGDRRTRPCSTHDFLRPFSTRRLVCLSQQSPLARHDARSESSRVLSDILQVSWLMRGLLRIGPQVHGCDTVTEAHRHRCDFPKMGPCAQLRNIPGGIRALAKPARRFKSPPKGSCARVDDLF